MKETSRFYSSLILLIVLNGVIKPFWIFGIDRQVQNEVGVTAYGSYFAIFNLSIVLGFLHDCGLTAFYNRQLAARNYELTGNPGNFLLLKFLLALSYMAVVFFIAFISGIDRWDIVFYVAMTQVLASQFVFFRAIITAQQWFHTDAWLSVLDKLLMIVVCFPFLYIPSWLGGMSIERFLVLQMICTAIAMLITCLLLLAKGFHFSFKSLWPDKRVLKAALPFAIIILLMSFHYRLDGFLLERLSSAAEAGKYAGAYRLLDAANMIGYLLTSFLLPYIARHHSDGNMMTGVILNVRHILVVFSLSISSIVIFMAPWIQKTLYHHNDASYVEVMQWCIPALIFYSLLQIYGSVMTATGKIKAFILITFISVVINITVNLFLIPTLGAKGSCIAAICSQAFCGLTSMWYCRQKLQVPLDVRSWIIYILAGGLVAGFLYLSSYLTINRLVVMLVAGMIALILLWLTKLINLKNWKQYING
jgi:O-antigen/teichoic acid export membrane protein